MRPQPGDRILLVPAAEFVFDTHRFVKRLTSAGLDEPVAEVLAAEHANLLNSLVTRKDLADAVRALEASQAAMETRIRADFEVKLAELKVDLETKLAELKVDLETKLANIRTGLMRWMFGALMAQTALIVALIKLLP